MGEDENIIVVSEEAFDFLLKQVMEECVEVAHSGSKVLRFGLNDSATAEQQTNLQNLQDEIEQLLTLLEMLRQTGVPMPHKDAVSGTKLRRFTKYAKYSAFKGKLSSGACRELRALAERVEGSGC